MFMILSLPIIGSIDILKLLEVAYKSCVKANGGTRHTFAGWVHQCRDFFDQSSSAKDRPNSSVCLSALVLLWLNWFVFCAIPHDKVKMKLLSYSLMIASRISFPLALLFLSFLYDHLDAFVDEKAAYGGYSILQTFVPVTFL